MATLRGKARLTLGVVANEVFATDVGRMGGFGWAVRQVARFFADRPELGVDVVLMVAERPPVHARLPERVHDTPVVWPTGSPLEQLRRARAMAPDLLLSIDYRSGYRRWFYATPRVPIVVWVRDPWATGDRERIATLRIPGAEDTEPRGVHGPDPHSLAQVVSVSRALRRPVLFATTARELGDRVPDTYGVTPSEVRILPNIVEPMDGPPGRAARPLVVFLARLDPVKRPWLFVALAERFPDVDFVAMGQPHFRGPGTWAPGALPPNLRLAGHTDEAEKRKMLSAAWVLVNTSIHEGLSVSFLEALAHEVPIVAAVDPDEVVSRFGLFTGRAPGAGLELVPRFEQALRRLLDDPDLRAGFGAAGREWVEATHSAAAFVAAFGGLVRGAGLEPPAGLERIANGEAR
jgi:glycosyltransferase involved in cell wall biosynthesis